MSGAPAWLPAPFLAFQVWDAVGWLGQGVFTWRILQQWIASEREGRSVVPTRFWTWSLLGTALLLVYAFHRGDPVFYLGFLVNGFLYARNLVLARRADAGRAKAGSPVLPVLLGLTAFLGVVVYGVLEEQHLLRVGSRHAFPWLAVGFAGQALWSSRFVVQWYASERLGRSVLPASFFWMSLAGAVCLFAYAVHRVDWVMMAAYALNPVPYARNLVLIYRERRGAGAAGPPPPEEESS